MRRLCFCGKTSTVSLLVIAVLGFGIAWYYGILPWQKDTGCECDHVDEDSSPGGSDVGDDDEFDYDGQSPCKVSTIDGIRENATVEHIESVTSEHCRDGLNASHFRLAFCYNGELSEIPRGSKCVDPNTSCEIGDRKGTIAWLNTEWVFVPMDLKVTVNVVCKGIYKQTRNLKYVCRNLKYVRNESLIHQADLLCREEGFTSDDVNDTSTAGSVARIDDEDDEDDGTEESSAIDDVSEATSSSDSGINNEGDGNEGSSVSDDVDDASTAGSDVGLDNEGDRTEETG